MNKHSNHNNFYGIILPGGNKVGTLEQCSDYANVIINCKIEGENPNYSLFLQQSNTNISNSADAPPPQIQPNTYYALSKTYFRVAIINNGETPIDVVVESNLVKHHIGDEGFLVSKIDEVVKEQTLQTLNSKIDEVVKEQTLQTLNSKFYDEPLTKKNVDGKCFQVSSEWLDLQFDNNQWRSVFTIFNPADSGKTIYIYNIVCSVRSSDLTDAFRVHIARVNSVISNGSGMQPVNLNFNNNTTGIANVKRSANSNYLTYTNGNGTVLTTFIKPDGSTLLNDYQEEYIIIPEGKGLIFNYFHTKDNADGSNWFSPCISVRYFEE